MEKIKKYDVVIIGGGTSGCACAYNCAKNGLKTLLVEKNNFLGGLMSGDLVTPIMKSSVENINCDFYNKLISEAKKYNAQITYKDGNNGWLNSELLKIILDRLIIDSEASILFETDIASVKTINNQVKQIELTNGFLSIPIEAKYFIDATGSGIFSKKCGCRFLNDNSLNQKNSLRFIMGNVDVEKFAKFIKAIDDNEDITNTYRNDIDTNNELHFTTASTWDTNIAWAFDKILLKGVKEGLLKDEHRSYFQLFSVAGAPGLVAFNCPRIENYKESLFDSSFELVKAREAIYRLANFAKKYFDGFNNAYIVNIATQTGKREENRVLTKYVVSKEDLINSKTFDNPVLRASYGIDIHTNDKNCDKNQKLNSYEIPLECLMSADFDNLFVIGKILGADFSSHSALRVQKSCMSMGEAVAKHIAKL